MRVVSPIARRADEMLAIDDVQPLPRGVTPHKLRHTFASVLIALGRDPSYVQHQLSNHDARFTLTVYTHLMKRSDDERERLRALVEGRDLPTPHGLEPIDAGREPSAAQVAG